MEEQMLRMISKQLEELTTLLGKQEKQRTKIIGRPTKEHVVARYRENYPEGKKSECVRATGMSIKTVSKYWEKVAEKSSTRRNERGFAE